MGGCTHTRRHILYIYIYIYIYILIHNICVRACVCVCVHIYTHMILILVWLKVEINETMFSYINENMLYSAKLDGKKDMDFHQFIFVKLSNCR